MRFSKNSFWILITILFFSQTYAQKNVFFWKEIENKKPSYELISRVYKQKQQAKKWTQLDEIEFLKSLTKFYYETRYFDSSIVYANKGVDLAKTMKNDSLQAMLLRFKGNSLYYLQNKQKASQSLNEALHISKSKGFRKLEADIYTNLGILAIDKVKIPDALDLLEKSISLHQTVSDSLYPGFLQARYLHLACKYHIKKEKKILKQCKALLEDLRKIQDVKLIVGHMFFYVGCLVENNESLAAIPILNEAIRMVENSGDIDLQRQASNEKALILYKLGRYKEAYLASSQSLDLYAKMLERDVTKAASDAEIKYRTKEKILELRNQKTLLKKEKEEKVLYLFLASMVLLLLLSILLYVQKNYKLKTIKIEQENKEIALNKILEGEEKERTRIAKELHDGVVQELTAVYLSLNQKSEIVNPIENQEIQQRVKQISSDVRNLSHAMMPISIEEKGLTKAIDELFQRSLSLASIHYSFESFNLENGLSPKIELNLYRIIQELINNVLKHSQATEVNCLLRKKEQELVLMFEDNGVGFDFKQETNRNGLQNLRSRLNFLHGNLELKSTENGNGVYYLIKVPLES